GLLTVGVAVDPVSIAGPTLDSVDTWCQYERGSDLSVGALVKICGLGRIMESHRGRITIIVATGYGVEAVNMVELVRGCEAAVGVGDDGPAGDTIGRISDLHANSRAESKTTTKDCDGGASKIVRMISSDGRSRVNV